MAAATNLPAAGVPLNINKLCDELLNRSVGKPVLQVDEALNDSDKILTVPADVTWEILSIRVELTTTATVGDRQIVIQVRDGANDVVDEVVAGNIQAASLTRNYHFGVGRSDLTAFRDTDHLETPTTPWMLPETFDLRIFDNNAVDAAADDMVVQMLVLERTEI